MTAIAISASEMVLVIQKLVVPKNNRRLRPLSTGDMDVVANIHSALIPDTNSPVALNSLPDVVNFRNQFKEDKFKRPKAHPTLSLHTKFRNADAKRTQPHWRTLKKAPLKEVAQTSVASLLNKATPVKHSHRNVSVCQPTCPPSPRRKYKKSTKGDSFIIINNSTSISPEKENVEYPPSTPVIFPPVQNIPSPPVEGGNRCDSAALLTASHSPVRGHDPGLHSRGAYLALIVDYLNFCVCRFRHMIGVAD